MLVQLPDNSWVNPQSVQGVTVTPDQRVAVIYSTRNQLGNHYAILTPADGEIAEDLCDDIVLIVNEGCGRDTRSTGGLTC